MFYAKFISDKYQTSTVGDMDNRPQNFDVIAFETKADRQAAIDAAWEAGGNGFKVNRSQVERYFGRDFRILSTGLVMGETDYMFHVDHATVPIPNF